MAKTSKKSAWGSDWTIGVRLWIERQGKAVLGEGRAELLQAIDRLHSITAAAKTVGISYRKAWSMIQEVNQAVGEPLVHAAVGGVKGGGAQLTERGRFAVEVYGQLHQVLHESATDVLQRIVHADAKSQDCVHLAAAISLQEVVGQLLAEYGLQRPAVHVRAVYGASNELADHLLAGAPCDLFISAEAGELDRLAAAGRLLRNSRRIVASNGLVAIGLRGGPAVKTPTQLKGDTLRRIALAEPECPLGRYSLAYLTSAKIYPAIAQKILHVDNSRAVLSAVAAGVADVGLAFASDAARSAVCQTLFEIPQAEAAAEYVAGIVKGSRQHEAAQSLLDYICSAAGARCFRRQGFLPAK